MTEMHRIAISALFLSCGAMAAGAQETDTPISEGESGIELHADADLDLCARDGIAVGGYDPVSYRRPDGPIRGSGSWETEFEGRTYRFATQANLDAFLSEPSRFVPAYSGFCAITLALGRLTCPEYTNFKIEDDRLYLFEVTGFTNGRTLWNSDAAGYRRQADANYRRLTEKR